MPRPSSAQRFSSWWYSFGIPEDGFTLTFSEPIAALGFFGQVSSGGDAMDADIFGSTVHGSGSVYWNSTFFMGIIAESPSETFTSWDISLNKMEMGEVVIARWEDLKSVPVPSSALLLKFGIVVLVSLKRKNG